MPTDPTPPIPPPTKAFIDARCRKCHAHIGWYGTVLDHPGCPRCGTKPDVERLNADHEEMVRFQTMLAELRKANPGYGKWRDARVAAGLTLRQAAKILEIAPSDLSDFERGQNRPSEALAARMARCYQGDDDLRKET